MITCTACGVAKVGQHFPLVRGKRSDVCKKCTKAAAEAAPPEPASDVPALEIEPGHGLKAWLEGGGLQIVQGDDGIVLSRTELKVLWAQFAPWVEAA